MPTRRSRQIDRRRGVACGRAVLIRSARPLARLSSASVKVVFLGRFFRHAGKVLANDFIAVYARLLAQLHGFTNNLVPRPFTEITQQRISLAPCRKSPHGLE